jgi:hypothetical protein
LLRIARFLGHARLISQVQHKAINDSETFFCDRSHPHGASQQAQSVALPQRSDNH